MDQAGLALQNPAFAVPAPGPLRGQLDRVAPDWIEGWAQDSLMPETPVALDVLDNGLRLGVIVADRFRPDLAKAGLGSGQHGFSFMVPGGLAPEKSHFIQVQRACDGHALPGSPWILPGILPGTGLPAAATSLQGHLAHVSRGWLAGWAWDSAQGDAPVTLEVLDNGVRIASVVANMYRQDLALEGIGDGRHGFELFIPGGLSPDIKHTLHVRRESDGADVRDSPAIIEAANRFDAALQQTVAQAVEALMPGPNQDRVLHFIAGQTERLLRNRAESDAKRAARLAHRHFRRRWGGTEVAHQVEDPGMQALVIDDDMPDLSRNAGSHAILSHMRSLQRLGYEVSFVAANSMASSDPARDALEQEGFRVCHAPFYASVEEVLRLRAQCFDAIYLHRVCNAAKYLAIIRCHCPNAHVIYSVADLHYVRLERQAAIEERPELLARSRRLRLTECTCAWSADAVITHSHFEADLLRRTVREANVHVVPWHIGLPPPATAWAQRQGVAFIGSYAHHPNVDAARFLAEEVMELVWQRNRNITCLLVGSDMPAAIRGLQRPGIVVLGQIGDLASIYHQVRLTVAPLRYGAGVKGKVLESLAAGLPCVMTPVAAEGIGLPALFKDLIHADAAGLAVTILRLYDNLDSCQQIGAAGREFIAASFTASRVDTAMTAALGGRVRVAQNASMIAAE
jgi:glycosyltransferase involved in cell wall biosynthesis